MLLTTHAVAAIYQWTDAKGVVHFSDNPEKQARPVVLTAPMLTKTSKNNASAKLLPGNQLSEPVDYTLQIQQPADQATLWNNQGIVTVILQTRPALQSHDKIRLLLDGSPVQTPQAILRWELTNVARGAHQLQAQRISAEGKLLAASPSSIFYLQQPGTRQK